MTKKTKIIAGVAGGVLLLGGIGSLNKNADKNSANSYESSISSYSSTMEESEIIFSSGTSQEEVSEPEQSNESKYKLNSGEILDVKELDDVLIVKAKVNSQLSDKLTINQNYHNAVSIIKSGGDKFKEIQYWAVADSNSGDEIKIISFTIPENVIKDTASEKVVAIQYPDLVTDLWVLPSLLPTESSISNETSLIESTTTSSETPNSSANESASSVLPAESSQSSTQSAPETAEQSSTPAIEPQQPSTEHAPQNSEPPIEAPSLNGITLVSFNNNFRRNEDATIKIQGKPNTQYSISVYYSSGPSKADGLEPKMSDADGYVSWTWHVGGSTSTKGTKRLTISGGGEKFETTFTVSE